MNELKHFNLIDRSRFGSGDWDAEPDRIYWVDEATELPCLIKRNSMGNLCGYVAVSQGHPLYGTFYDDADLAENPHGGLTYSDFCQDDDKETGICHVATDGNDKVWWFGFDCAHGGDLVPSMKEYNHSFGDTYRTVDYVRAEVLQLAESLAKLNPEAS